MILADFMPVAFGFISNIIRMMSMVMIWWIFFKSRFRKR
jgi:hypothetical protein